MQIQAPRYPDSQALPQNVLARFSSRAWALFAVCVFSFLYFAETAIRASEKRLWYDELCTYYICRLPTLAESWTAVSHGADYNPPLFYVIHRTAMAIAGQGLIAMRLPEIVAFWVLCLSLFAVVYRRAGLLAGCIAMAFPMVTGAFFYAYDARPHGLVLGFCGLAVLCWQRWNEKRTSTLWLVGFGLCLEAAFLTHCYAILLVIPFGLIEVLVTMRQRAITWGFWVVLALPAAIAVASFIPLLRSYKVTLGSAGFSDAFPATVWQLREFYRTLLQSGVVLFVAGTALLVLGRSIWTDTGREETRWPSIFARSEILLAIALLAMPVYGLVLAKLVHGPFFARYFLCALLGVCLVMAIGLGARGLGRISAIFLVLIVSMIAYSLTSLIYHRAHGQSEELIEPSTKATLNTDPRDPLANHPLLRLTSGRSLPIVTPDLLDFLYLVHYWKPRAKALYALSLSSDQQPYRLNRAVREWCRVPFNREQTFAEFVPAHVDFYLYGPREIFPLVSGLMAQGGSVKSLQTDLINNHFLVEIHMQ